MCAHEGVVICRQVVDWAVRQLAGLGLARRMVSGRCEGASKAGEIKSCRVSKLERRVACPEIQGGRT